MKKIRKFSSNTKNKIKMELEDPYPSQENKNDRTNNNRIHTWNSQRFLSRALLSLRWKATGSIGIIDDNFDNFVKLLCN